MTTTMQVSEPFGENVAPGTLRMERLLPGPIERVWSYLVDPEKRALWFAGGAMEPRKGGKMELVFNHANLSHEPTPEKYRSKMGMAMPGDVLAWDPPRLLAYTFAGKCSGDPDASEVTFELSEQGSKVLLVLTHRKIAKRKYMVGYAGGWHAHLAILLDRLEGREPRGFWTNHGPLEAKYEELLPADAAG